MTQKISPTHFKDQILFLFVGSSSTFFVRAKYGASSFCVLQNSTHLLPTIVTWYLIQIKSTDHIVTPHNHVQPLLKYLSSL